MNVYLASRYQDHPLMREWKNLLNSIDGIAVTSRWINGDHELTGINDDSERIRFALEDIEDIEKADVLIVRSDPSFFHSGRGGRHVELGIGIALKKPIYLIGERENVFHWLPEVIVFATFESMLEWLRKRL